MKKTYQNPSVQVLHVEEILPIAASVPGVTINHGESIDAGDVEVKDAGDWGDIWD